MIICMCDGILKRRTDERVLLWGGWYAFMEVGIWMEICEENTRCTRLIWWDRLCDRRLFCANCTSYSIQPTTKLNRPYHVVDCTTSSDSDRSKMLRTNISYFPAYGLAGSNRLLAGRGVIIALTMRGKNLRSKITNTRERFESFIKFLWITKLPLNKFWNIKFNICIDLIKIYFLCNIGYSNYLRSNSSTFLYLCWKKIKKNQHITSFKKQRKTL